MKLAHETKLGLIFIGILAAVFGALLVKRLTHPQSMPSMNLFADAPKSTDPLAPKTALPTAKQVSPRGENEKPPEYAGGDLGNSTSGNLTGGYSASSAMAGYGSRSTGDMPSTGSRTTDPTSLLAAPMPMGTSESRYPAAGATAADSPSRQSDDSSRSSAKSLASSGEALPYQSGYSGVGPSSISADSTPPPSVPGNTTASGNTTTAGITQPKPLPTDEAANPVPRTTGYEAPSYDSPRSDSPRSDSARYDSPKYDGQPTAGATYDPPTTRPSMGNQSAGPSATMTNVTATPSASRVSPYSSNSTGASSAGSVSSSTERYNSPPPTPGSSTAWTNSAAAVSSNPQSSMQSTMPSAPLQQQSFGQQSVGQQSITQQYNVMPPAAARPNAVIQPQREGNQYAVQPNDSYWSISQKVYGNGAYFKALYQHNHTRLKEPDQLKVGQILSVPDEATLARLYPDLCPKPRKPIASVQQRLVSASTRMRTPGRVYTVAEGDTLFEIARHELGKASRWAEIYDLNRDVLGDDFDYLRAGTELILPNDVGVLPTSRPTPTPDSSGGTATRQGNGPYSR